MVLISANWFDARLIQIFGLNMDAGTLIFPLTFLLADLITEVYGYKHARQTIWAGFLFNTLFILYGQLVIHLPSPPYSTNNDLFASILHINTRIIFASIISYFIAEPWNSYLISKLKITMHGRFMGIRFILSTMVASGIDSFTFGFIAFYGMFNINNLIGLILTMWFIKVLVEILGLPISILTANKLKAIEKMDIYDIGTKYNFFRLENNYEQNTNQY